MADLDPIEIKLVLNSPEILEGFKSIVSASGNFDESIESSKGKFAAFVAEQLKANGYLLESAELTAKQTAALDRHIEAVTTLKGKITETFDPTQISVYEFQLSQIEDSIAKIIESSNKNALLMDSTEIDAAKEKIKEAQTLLDKISDTTITPDFASPEELEILSNEINKTDDGLQQLGTVIDFISAKMSGLDQGSEQFQQLQADIDAANQLLGRTPQLYDATGNSINQMSDALKTFQEQLAAETDPEAIKTLNTNIQTLENGIDAVKNAGRTGFDEFGNKIVEQKEKTVSLQSELETLVNKMAKLRLANQEGSQEYEDLKNQAVEARTAIANTNKEISSSASTTSSFDKLIQVTSGITAGFTLAAGASALFGDENENAEKVIQKVTGAMAVLQSLQEIQIQIKNRDTVATSEQTAVQAAYSLVVGTSTGALKIFRIALAATGIGLVIILIAALIANWDKITASVKRSFPALDGFGDKLDTMKSYIMGFLRAYLSLYETVFKTILKLINLDFKGALNEVKNVGANAVNSFNSAKSEQDQKNLVEKNREKVRKALEDYNRETELIEKRTGKTQYDRRAKAAAAEASLYDKGTKEYKDKMQDRNVVIAEQEKERTDTAKKFSEKRQKDAEAAAKKAQQLADQLAENQKKVADKITEYENNLINKDSDGDAIAAVKKKYQALRDEAEKYSVKSPVKMRIDIAEAKETKMVEYDLQTKELLKNINEQTDLYAAYESFKTNIAKTEFAKRNKINLEEFGSFSDMLDDQIKKLKDKQDLTAQEAERLKSLQEVKTTTDNNKDSKAVQDLDKAALETITFGEKIEAIKKEYADRAILLQKIADEKLRAAKLLENQKQLQDTINNANAEFYAKSSIYEQMSQNLIGITKRELTVRIASLQEYLNRAKGFITQEQNAFIQSEIDKAKSIQSNSNIGVYENSLLKEKKELLDKIEAKGKLNIFDPQDAADLDKINQELKKTIALKAQAFANAANDLSAGFHDMASAIGDSNEGLSSTLDTVGDILGVAGSAAGAFASFASGDIIGGITGVMKTISGIFSIGKKSRESEKKAQEEIKKRQEEQLQSQLEYNATLRQRMIDEVKLNDLYKSRVDNIKEEMAARKNAVTDNLRDQQNLFNKLLGMQTAISQYTEKYGGFLGIGRKTRIVDVNASLSSLLGVGTGTQITDDLFKKLEQINASTPLTGDAKAAYEQLKRLRDEYGSIADAQLELEKRLKDAVTGTTAQSLADSIREGLKSGKKSFADFADDIEGFLRDAILAGISAKIIEPQIQQLQDALAEMLGDGILSADERAQFQAMYLAIANQSQEYMDLINQAGVNLTTGSSSINSLQGAIKGMSQESADIISGRLGGLTLTQFETNQILKSGSAAQLEKASQQIEIQMNIEKNTKRTADNTEKLYDVNDNVVKVADGQDKYYKALQAAGIIK